MNKFLKIKKIITFKKNLKQIKKIKKNILICDKGEYDSSFRACFMSKIINENFESKFFVLTNADIKKSNENINIYKLFKIQNFIIDFKKKDIIYNFLFFFKIILIYLRLIINNLSDKNYLKKFIEDFKFENIHVGDLIYDSYIRPKHNFLKFSFFSPFFFKNLYLGLTRIKQINEIIKNKKINIVIVSTKNFINTSNIAIRCAAKNKIRIYIITNNFFKKINNYKDALNSIYYISKKELEIKKNKKKNVESFFLDRFIKKIPGKFVSKETFKKVYVNNSRKISKKIFLKKNLKGQIDLNNIESEKIIINLFALNAFSDSPRGSFKNGTFLFIDYYDVFIKTINQISKFDNTNKIWLVKTHPAHSKYNEIGIADEYVKKFEHKNIFMCPDKIDNVNLFKIINNLFTPRSTIALEFACFGKMPMVSCSNPVSHFDFIKAPKTEDEYYDELKKDNFSIKLNKDQVISAKTALYLLESHKNSQLPNSAILPELNFDQILGKKNSFKNYFESIDNNIDKNKISYIEQDVYYQKLKENLIGDLIKN